MYTSMKIYPTRYPTLAYSNFGRSDWRFVDATPGAMPNHIGSIYKSKAELLADLDNFYTTRFGVTARLVDRLTPEQVREINLCLESAFKDGDSLAIYNTQAMLSVFIGKDTAYNMAKAMHDQVNKIEGK